MLGLRSKTGTYGGRTASVLSQAIENVYTYLRSPKLTKLATPVQKWNRDLYSSKYLRA